MRRWARAIAVIAWASSCCAETPSPLHPYLAALQPGRQFELAVPQTSQRYAVTIARRTADAITLRWTARDGEPGRLPVQIRLAGSILAVDDVAFDVTGVRSSEEPVVCVEGEEVPELGTTQCRGSCFRSLCFHRTLGLVSVQGYPWVYPEVVATACQRGSRGRVTCPP